MKGTMYIDYKTGTMSCRIDYKTGTLNRRIGCTDWVRQTLNNQKNRNPTKMWQQEARPWWMTPKHKKQNQMHRPSWG